MSPDEVFMQEALRLAREAAAVGEVPVGAVIVQDGQIVARAFNQVERSLQGTDHAELLAIRMASERLGAWRLDRCTLYVTKEPCAMCAGAIVNSRISRLVFGCSDRKYGAAGGCINVCTLPEALHKVQITSGVLDDECLEVLKEFFRQRRLVVRRDEQDMPE